MNHIDELNKKEHNDAQFKPITITVNGISRCINSPYGARLGCIRRTYVDDVVRPEIHDKVNVREDFRIYIWRPRIQRWRRARAFEVGFLAAVFMEPTHAEDGNNFMILHKSKRPPDVEGWSAWVT